MRETDNKQHKQNMQNVILINVRNVLRVGRVEGYKMCRSLKNFKGWSVKALLQR